MKQKLAIARGLIADPSILFFDEPTRSLDPISASQIRSFVRERLVRDLGKTVFLTTHNLYEAEEISDRVGIINRGKILAAGTVAEISARLRTRERYRLTLAEAPDGLVESFRTVGGVVDAQWNGAQEGHRTAVDLTVSDASSTVPDLVALCVARGARVLECSRRESSLTEIFAELITEDSGHADPS